jgi:hypothetical protein
LISSVLRIEPRCASPNHLAIHVHAFDPNTRHDSSVSVDVIENQYELLIANDRFEDLASFIAEGLIAFGRIDTLQANIHHCALHFYFERVAVDDAHERTEEHTFIARLRRMLWRKGDWRLARLLRTLRMAVMNTAR